MTYKTISKTALIELQGKAKNVIGESRTLACKTVAVEKFRHENYIRDLPAYIVDEPPVLLGDDTAPNPSEALLAALGSCIAVGVQANLVNRDIAFRRIELQLEADIDTSVVWGTGSLAGQNIGFTAVRVRSNIDADLKPTEINELMEHVLAYSPVTGSLNNPVPVSYIQ